MQGFFVAAEARPGPAPGTATARTSATARSERSAFTRGSVSRRRRYRDPLLWSSQAMADLPENFQTAPLAEVDPEIATVLERELHRQQRTLEMIASENFVPQAVLDAAARC